MGNDKKTKLVPPEGGWGWMVVLGVSLVNLSTRPIEPSFGLLFGDLLSELSIATTGAGIIVSTYEAIINFSGLLVGPLIKSYSYRKVALLGSLLCGFGLLSTYPAYSMTHILCTYSIINGLGVGFSSSSTFVSLNHYFKKRRGQAVGLTMTGTGLGLLLMPQAVRYLTEEYDFQGSVLILGAFALNSCVGSCLLQPVKWHLKREPCDEDDSPSSETQDKKILNDKISAVPKNLIERQHSFCPSITITNTIAENDEEEDTEATETQPLKSTTESNVEQKRKTPECKVERPKFYLKTERKYSLIEKGDRYHQESPTIEQSQKKFNFNNGLNKSLTEPKFDKYFEDNHDSKKMNTSDNKRSDSIGQCIPICNCNISSSRTSVGKIDNTNCKNTIQVMSGTMRKRKGSTISNLSNLDFHGSGLHIHAIEAEKQEEEGNKKKTKESENDQTNNNSTTEKGQTFWKRFATFMDLDLLKDPVYLNILFGLSIFYVAELNFKMIVPFFLADLGRSKSDTAECLSWMAASDIVARVVLPPISDKIKISRRTMFMIAGVFLGASRSALAEAGEWIQLEVLLVISGFFRGATLINFMLVISEYCDTQLNKLPAAFGLHMVAKGIFIVAFGPLIGVIRDVTQSFPLSIHAQTVMILLCTFAWSIEYGVQYIQKKRKDKETNNT